MTKKKYVQILILAFFLVPAAAPTAEHHAVIELLGKYDPKGHRIIRDPYYDSGSAGFEEVFEQCKRACLAFLEQHK